MKFEKAVVLAGLYIKRTQCFLFFLDLCLCLYTENNNTAATVHNNLILCVYERGRKCRLRCWMRFHRQNIPFLVQQNCHGLKREPYLFACISHKRNGHQKDHRPSLFSFLVTTFNFSIQDEKKKTKWSTRCGGK